MRSAKVRVRSAQPRRWPLTPISDASPTTPIDTRLATGAPSKGIALLQGLAVCGQCGRRMTVRYSGPECMPRRQLSLSGRFGRPQ
ncbi:MAG: hypothetical protein EOR68_33850 [Mesorhizobium sp.]|uniref:zinc ribbon domain-containing protein n=1 Tax=Mesorhizobium sp. TaxID=1871066 RepID=UPI000FE55A18|nr:MAG: hypothetical protein EOR68_33850 [Mesorhizobium sp.]